MHVCVHLSKRLHAFRFICIKYTNQISFFIVHSHLRSFPLVYWRFSIRRIAALCLGTMIKATYISRPMHITTNNTVNSVNIVHTDTDISKMLLKLGYKCLSVTCKWQKTTRYFSVLPKPKMLCFMVKYCWSSGKEDHYKSVSVNGLTHLHTFLRLFDIHAAYIFRQVLLVNLQQITDCYEDKRFGEVVILATQTRNWIQLVL